MGATVEDDLSDRPAGATVRAKVRAARRARGRLTGWLLDAHTGERQLRAQARAEREVGRRLASLPAGWRVLHSIPLDGDADIDHLVLGPAGVFCLATRNHLSAHVRVNGLAVVADGRETLHLFEARDEAAVVRAALAPVAGEVLPVRPVVVVLARQMKVKRQPEDVDVVGRRGLVAWLLEQPEVLPAERVEALHERARWASTWLSHPSAKMGAAEQE